MPTKKQRAILGQFQNYRQQLQAIMMQKENLKLQSLEAEKALEELEESEEKQAYKITGPIMIRKKSSDLKEELKERKENFNLRVKTLEKTEERITKKLKKMEPQIRKMMKK